MKSATVPHASQGSAYFYTCEQCRQAIVLSADDRDGPDGWKAVAPPS
ncbi:MULTISPECIES: hypothetical protein [unclassified Cupriavidus]